MSKYQGTCDTCAYLTYDDEYQEYYCDINMDEDDYARLLEDRHAACPYYRNGDEYAVVRHQI
ncbi:MAG: DUF6472 family protein [Eubacteriales bacterium]|nr:DUF6472 family protein [Eubacteriales bacterium]